MSAPGLAASLAHRLWLRLQRFTCSCLPAPAPQVLAEMHSARVSSARDLLTQPAAFVHRICELSQAVGLSPADICELWLSDPAAMRANIVPRPAAAAPQQAAAPVPAVAALPAAVQQASPQQPAPQLPHRNSAAQQREIQKLLGISHGEWAAALAADPGLDAAPPAIVAGVLEWLRSAPLGFSRADVRKLWLSQPRLFCQPAEALQQGLLGKADFLLQYGGWPAGCALLLWAAAVCRRSTSKRLAPCRLQLVAPAGMRAGPAVVAAQLQASLPSSQLLAPSAHQGRALPPPLAQGSRRRSCPALWPRPPPC